MVTLYNVISSDGYIARKDGSEEFIPDELWSNTLELFERYDVLVMGRKTYDAMQKYDKKLLEPFEKLSIKKVIVTNDKDFQPKSGYIVSHSPEDALRMNANTLVSSGPTLNNYFFEKKLIDKVVLHQIPASIGEGIRPFAADIQKSLVLLSETPIGKAKELTYRVPN